jgi:dGTP triphosphohydrolase
METPRTSREDRSASEARIHRYTKEREALFSPPATRNTQAVRRKNRKPDDIRTPFSRDADRIIHTRAYTRYIDKTQVFYLVENDHITHRVIHVQLVSKIARTIGRSLRLNEDLIEAIALGHDIGHIPYGHFGESCLSALCEEQGIGKFSHNVQSIRFLDQIEDQDLTMQVLDGILCHNGESDDVRISPVPCPDWEAFDRKVAGYAAKTRMDPPMTLEGCVVKFADTIAYIGRDLQDAEEVGLIAGPDDIPKDCRDILGSDNRIIIDTLIHDLIDHSSTEDDAFISYSRDAERALVALRAFSRRQIYDNPKLTAEREKITGMYRTLFCRYLDDINADRRTSRIFPEFIESPWVNREYVVSTAPAGLVRDYIAGMTDRYFLRRFEECVLPHKTEGSFR